MYKTGSFNFDLEKNDPVLMEYLFLQILHLNISPSESFESLFSAQFCPQHVYEDLMRLTERKYSNKLTIEDTTYA